MERKQVRKRIALVYKQFKYEGDVNREQVIHTLLSAPPSKKHNHCHYIVYMPNRYVYPDTDTFLKNKMVNILLWDFFPLQKVIVIFP